MTKEQFQRLGILNMKFSLSELTEEETIERNNLVEMKKKIETLYPNTFINWISYNKLEK